MKGSNNYKKYFQKRNDTVRNLLNKPSHKFTASDLHKLRVEIKKIKALFKFIDFFTKDFKKRSLFKPYRSIFQKAGEIRELQLEESTLKKYAGQNKLKKYYKYLREMKLEKEQVFFREITPELKNEIKNSRMTVSFFIDRSHKISASYTIKNNKKKIEKIIAKENLKEKEIHRLRKKLKTYYYATIDLSTKNC